MIAQLDSEQIQARPLKVLPRLISYALFEGRPVTTRGQWINPLVLKQFSLVKQLPEIKNVVKPIYVLGTGRSGTTILGKLLSVHRHVGFLNEPKAMWHSIFPYEDLVGSYSRHDATYRLDAEQATPKVCKAARKLFGYYLAVTGSQRLVDKYPEMIFRVPFIQAIFPDAKFIFLVRDGWDTIHSIAAWSRRNSAQCQGELHDWWGVSDRKWHLLVRDLVAPDAQLADVHQHIEEMTDHIDRAAVEWIVTMREGLKLLKTHPQDIYILRYEDLTQAIEASLSKLLNFCELEPDQAFLDYALRVLEPVPTKSPLNLHPSIQPLFLETMKALNYR